MMSRCLGKKDYEMVRRSSAFGFYCALRTVTCGAVPAILNVVLDYLVRAEGNAAQAGIGTMGGCFLNIALDPVFILPWGLNMGASVAGLATCLANCAVCLYFLKQKEKVVHQNIN